MEVGLKKMDDMNPQQPATAVETGPKLPPEPRLQGAPEPDPDKPGQTKSSMLPLDDMAAYAEKVNKQAAAYGWVDQQGGVAHIPIDRAKEIIAEKGLPKLSDALIGEVQSAEAARKLVLNAGANGGRSIKSQKPTVVPTPAPTGAGATTPVPTPAPPAAAQGAAAGVKH